MSLSNKEYKEQQQARADELKALREETRRLAKRFWSLHHPQRPEWSTSGWYDYTANEADVLRLRMHQNHLFIAAARSDETEHRLHIILLWEEAEHLILRFHGVPNKEALDQAGARGKAMRESMDQHQRQQRIAREREKALKAFPAELRADRERDKALYGF